MKTCIPDGTITYIRVTVSYLRRRHPITANHTEMEAREIEIDIERERVSEIQETATKKTVQHIFVLVARLRLGQGRLWRVWVVRCCRRRRLSVYTVLNAARVRVNICTTHHTHNDMVLVISVCVLRMFCVGKKVASM